MTELRYLDGPAFVTFLQAEGVTPGMLTDSERSRWRYWEKGGRADSLSTLVDRLLAQYGLPHSYIPDEVWSADQTNHQSRTGPRKRRTTRK